MAQKMWFTSDEEEEGWTEKCVFDDTYFEDVEDKSDAGISLCKKEFENDHLKNRQVWLLKKRLLVREWVKLGSPDPNKCKIVITE